MCVGLTYTLRTQSISCIHKVHKVLYLRSASFSNNLSNTTSEIKELCHDKNGENFVIKISSPEEKTISGKEPEWRSVRTTVAKLFCFSRAESRPWNCSHWNTRPWHCFTDVLTQFVSFSIYTTSQSRARCKHRVFLKIRSFQLHVITYVHGKHQQWTYDSIKGVENLLTSWETIRFWIKHWSMVIFDINYEYILNLIQKTSENNAVWMA